MRRAVARRAALCLMALQLVLTVALSLNLVVCSAANGHVALESASADGCCADEHVPAPSISRGPECGGCTDVPLAKTLIQRTESTDHAAGVRPRVSTAVLPPPIGVVRRIASAAFARALAPPPPALTARRVVVLVV